MAIDRPVMSTSWKRAPTRSLVALGWYKGIKGSGKFTLRLREVGPLVHGKCDTKTAKRVAGQAVITASGPVTLG
jgi:hypothetical protein